MVQNIYGKLILFFGNEITIKSCNHDRFIKVTFPHFPYVGIGSPGNGAPFVCIEPWYGIADEWEQQKN
jgi:galactose mutarotase-like enzyme